MTDYPVPFTTSETNGPGALKRLERVYQTDANGTVQKVEWIRMLHGGPIFRRIDDGVANEVSAFGEMPDGWTEAVPASARRPLSQAGFMDIALAAFGGGMSGAARYDNVWAAVEASSDAAVPFALKKFALAQALEYDQVAEFLNLFVAYGLGGFSQAECDAILAAWPTSNT